MGSRKNSSKKYSVLTGIIAAVLVAASVGIMALATPTLRYNTAMKLMEKGRYEKAAEDFEALGDFKDSEEKLQEARELLAQQTAGQEQDDFQ